LESMQTCFWCQRALSDCLQILTCIISYRHSILQTAAVLMFQIILRIYA
jgi:hypothetical protein